jgi:hypothetical protein
MVAVADDNMICRRCRRSDSRRLGALGVLGGENRFSSPSASAPISLTSGGYNPTGGQGTITAPTSSSSYLSSANPTAATYTFNLGNGGSSSQAQVASYIQSLGKPSNSQPLAVMNSSGNFVPPVAMEGTPSSSVGPAGSSGSSLSSGWNSFYGGTPGGWISSGLGWMGGALNSWGSSEASGGSVGLGTAGLFAGGVFSAASNLTNPVGSVLNLVEQSNNVGERYGVGWGVAYGAGSLIGATQLTEAIAGQNFATGQALSGLNRWGMGFAGISAGAGSAAPGMGVAGYNPALGSGAAEEISTLTSPYQVHIDPISGTGPMALDTTTFTSGEPTLNGGLRDPRQFWNAWNNIYPETVSEANLARIQLGRSPIVDEQWLQTFPEQSGYLGDTLIHHHLDYGPNAIPLPRSLHSQQPGWGYWHSQHAGGD